MKCAARQFLFFLLGAFLVLSVQSVLAKQATVTGELTYKNIKVYADGEVVDTTEAEPFIYDGTTYLPVRAVANAFGKEVTWNGETNTVYLGAVPSVYVETDTLLEDMYSYNSTFQQVSHVNNGADNINQKHTSGCIFKCGGVNNDGSVEYSLNGKFATFSGIIALPYVERNNNSEKVVTIYADGKAVYTSSKMKSGSAPEAFDIDVSETAVIKVKVEGVGQIALYDAVFYAK
ncbi:MAG: NPCBM/NEW2 domain-containing protein [Clostridiales bacterium]|nr:NPCBM/NEW2 domain-containing protein [Clostridiales bacterium]